MAEGGGLLNRYTVISRIVGSNPIPSASFSRAPLWVHGHTHDSADYTIGATRVLCNPRGYSGVELNPRFDPNLLVEVESAVPGTRA